MHKNAEALAELDENVLTADGLDDAIIGWTDSWDSSGSRAVRAVYSTDRVIEILVQRGMTEDEAQEYFEFNISGAYVGAQTPIFVHSFGGT